MTTRLFRARSTTVLSVMGVVILGLATARAASDPPPAGLGGGAMLPIDCPDALARGSIATIAGGGPGGDGGLATDARIDVTVGALAIDADGAVYFTGYYGNAVRKVGTDGVISTVAGPDTGAPFAAPMGLAFDPAGDLFVADFGGGRIWRIDQQGAIDAVAGTGTSGSSGDGGPATDAQIGAGLLSIDTAGDLYFDDTNRFRTITPDGTIHAFAGTGNPGFSGDGGPALDAEFREVIGTTTAPDGSVYLADTENGRVRRVDPDGIITTIAGTGELGYSGDGGPALEATFQGPVNMAIADDGSLYIADHHNNVVRRVDQAGIITTVAGSGAASAPDVGDCGLATDAPMQPWAIAVRGDILYIGDMGTNRIRVVRL